MRREGALTGSDFNDRSWGIRAGRVRDTIQDGLSNEEVLPEAAAH